MKLCRGWIIPVVMAGSVVGAHAQVPAPYEIDAPAYAVASDVGGPYAAIEVDPAAPRYGPTLLPPQEVYTLVRESGFSPLGAPRQRGLVYTISVINRDGEDGRLVINARNGRIVRFVPSYRAGDRLDEDLTASYGPVGPLPPPRIGDFRRGPPRPPALVPHVASRSTAVPLPREAPRPAEGRSPAEAKAPAPAVQQSAAVQKPVEPAASPAALTPPPPQIQPTQPMPQAQGLD